jgi:cytochrome P450
LVPKLIDELQYAFDIEVPKCDGELYQVRKKLNDADLVEEWTSINAYNMLLGLLTRATSRIICGDSICRNEKWLETVTNYTINVGITVVLLRPFPKFLRPLVAKFLPSVRKLNKQVRFVKNELFIPMINARRHAEKYSLNYEKPDDFLQWMMDGADNPRDADADFMAHNLFIIMSLAVVHTSSMLMTHMFYDLIEKPEYLEPLREEIQATLANGWASAKQSSFISQHRMDSFMKEVQRFNPTGEGKHLSSISSVNLNN